MSIGVVLSAPSSIDKEAKYAIDTLLSSLGLFYHFNKEPTNETFIINYGKYKSKFEPFLRKGGTLLNILPSSSFEALIEDRKFPTTSSFLYPVAEKRPASGTGETPFFFNYEVINTGKVLYTIDKKPVISAEKIGKGILVQSGVDIVCESFFFLSLTDTNRYKKEFVKRPIVNEYMSLLSDIISYIYKSRGEKLLTKEMWPNGKKFAVALTHDVDWLYRWRPKSTIKGVFTGKSREAISSLAGLKRDRWWNFDKIINLEQQKGFKSTFFFMPLSHQYRLKQAPLNEIKKAGNEIALHSISPENWRFFLKEKNILEKQTGNKVYGVRQHYLRLKLPKTFEIIDNTGLTYDTSLGSSQEIGFRSGFTLPYHPYRFSKREPFRFLELPLTVMDCALLKEESPKQAVDEIIKVAKKYNGLLVILWHQRVFDEVDFPSWGDTYKYILEKIGDGWIAQCQDIARWWLNRRKA